MPGAATGCIKKSPCRVREDANSSCACAIVEPPAPTNSSCCLARFRPNATGVAPAPLAGTPTSATGDDWTHGDAGSVMERGGVPTAASARATHSDGDLARRKESSDPGASRSDSLSATLRRESAATNRFPRAAAAPVSWLLGDPPGDLTPILPLFPNGEGAPSSSREYLVPMSNNFAGER